MTAEVLAPRVIDLGDENAIRRAADEDGALWLPGLIPAADVAPLADLVRGWLRENAWIDDAGRALVATPAYDAPEFVRLQQFVFPSPQFDALRRHPRLLQILEILFDCPAVPCMGDLVRVVAPSDPAGGTLPHQDAFYVVREPSMWTAWMPLAPTPMILGPLAIWPGSRTLGVLPHHGDGMGTHGIVVPDEARWVAADMKPGDVWLFERLTVHRSLPNVTRQSMRLSVDFRHVPEDPRGDHGGG